MREPTAGVKYQNEPIQGPLQKVEQSSSFNDLGREDARRIAEKNNPNTRGAILKNLKVETGTLDDFLEYNLQPIKVHRKKKHLDSKDALFQ